MLLSEICGLVYVRRPLWRQDRSVMCSVITQCSESLRTRNQTLLSHLRLPQPGGGGGYFTTDGQSASMYWCRAHSLTWDQILLPVGMLLSEICGLVSIGRPLWREDRSAMCSVITQWSESLRTRNHTLLSYLRLPQPGGGGGYFTTDGQSASMYWCRAHSLTCDQILLPVGMLLSEICGLVSVGRPLWREDGSVICSVITQWSESLRTRNHTLLSYLRLPQPGGPGSLIYIPQEQGGPVIPPGTGCKVK
jgi:hypothetical protein